MASSWGTSWGTSWGDAWGPIASDPGAMAASAGFTLSAVATITAQLAAAGSAALVVSATGTLSGGAPSNELAGSATFTFSAIGVLSLPETPDQPTDHFNYRAHMAQPGRYRGDPVIGRLAQRMRNTRRR